MPGLSSFIKSSDIIEKELIEHLPESMKELHEFLSLSDIAFIVDKIGGIKVFIPETVKPDSFLATSIGMEKASALANAFRGEILYIPKAVTLKRIFTREMVFRLRKQGISSRSIALQLKISDRTVQKYIKLLSEQDNKAAS